MRMRYKSRMAFYPRLFFSPKQAQDLLLTTAHKVSFSTSRSQFQVVTSSHFRDSQQACVSSNLHRGGAGQRTFCNPTRPASGVGPINASRSTKLWRRRLSEVTGLRERSSSSVFLFLDRPSETRLLFRAFTTDARPAAGLGHLIHRL